MNQDNIVIVILLVLGIVLFSNLAIFGLVRGSRGINLDWIKNLRGSIDQPFQKDEESLSELHRRVLELDDTDKKE